MRILSPKNDLCVKCYACVRACPVGAISFRNGVVSIIQGDCILCGNCVRACSQQANIVYNDLPLVQHWIDSGEEVVALVAPSFAASFDCDHRQFIGGLRQLGFKQVWEVAFGGEVYAQLCQKLLATAQDTVISTQCPAVVLMVEKHFPQLLAMLPPIKSPMMLTGDLVKSNYPLCKTVFIGPCLAKKAEAVNARAGNSIDAVINFNQLKNWLNDEQINLSRLPLYYRWDSPPANNARLLPLPGGLLKTLNLQQDVASLDVIEASGPIKCKSILRTISSGQLKPRIASLLACEGCTAGPEIASNELCFNKKQRVINYTNTMGKELLPPADYAQFASNIDIKRTFSSKQRIKKIFSEEQIWQVLEKTGKYTVKDLLNCGACGYETCRDKAIAVLRGKAEVQMCLPYLLQQSTEINKNISLLFLMSKWLEEQATVDILTGLYNHRAFQEQLATILREDRKHTATLALYLIDVDKFRHINDLYGQQSADQLLVQIAQYLKSYFSQGIIARYGGDKFAVILPNIKSRKEAFYYGKQMADGIKSHRFKLSDNVVVNATVSVGISCYPQNATTQEDLVKQANYALYTAKHTRNNAVLYATVLDDLTDQPWSENQKTINTIKTLNIVINAKDQYTYKHSERVVYYSEQLGRHLALRENEINHLKYGAFLHDIGKINVDMSILQKPTPLEEWEYETIKKHPVYGAEIAMEIPSLHQSIPVILYHHERYDGKGYPYGLKGKDIPLFGRIAAIADSFDAMTTDRPYRKALSYKKALDELINNAGSQFDPELVDIFVKHVKPLC